MRFKGLSKKRKIVVALFTIVVIIVFLVIINFKGLLNFYVNKTMGADFPQLVGEPKIGKWYAMNIDKAISSDGSKWQGYIRKGSENKVIVYFYGGGFSVDDFTAARSMDVKGGFYNPRFNTGLNVMTTAIAKWGIGKSSEENLFRDWTFIGIPYCNGDFHTGSGEKEYTALDGTKKTIYYNGYTNYQLMMKEALKYIGNTPEQLLVTGSSAGGFGASILADDVIDYFPQTQDITVLVDSSLLLTEKWHDIMVNEWHAPEKLSSVVTTDNITLDSLVALNRKRGDNVKILFDCSVRDFNLSQAQVFFDNRDREKIDKPISGIGKVEGDRFQKLLQEMVENLQTKIPGCGIYIWDEVSQDDGHLTVHTATGTKIYFDKKNRNPSMAEWLENAVNGNVESYGLSLLTENYD